MSNISKSPVVARFSNATSTSQTFLPETPTSEKLSDTIVNDEARLLFEWIGYSLVCEAIDIFGTVTNIINIICFVKQGLKDSVNVSLLGLAISDLCCLTTLIWTNLCMNPQFNKVDLLPFESVGFQYLSTGLLHANFTRITSWITAVITLERCLCITAPLKVKTLLTAKRTAIILIFVFIILLASGSPVYFVNKLDYVYFPERNKTLLGLVYTADRKSVERISYIINNAFIPFSAFAIIIVCTIILVIKLQNQTKWRSKSVTTTNSDKMSLRDQKVTKMVIMISTLFIACFVPVCITFIAMSVVPELAVDGRYRNTIIIFIGLCFILESTNSAGNIFMYYYMSSKYRAVFRQLFGLGDGREKFIFADKSLPDRNLSSSRGK